MASAFTTQYNKKVRVLQNVVGVCLPTTQEEFKGQKVSPKGYVAIWDTGATHSAITKKVADELELKPTGIAEVRYGSGKSSTNTYLVNIMLPSKVMVGQVRVTEVNLIPDDNTSDDQHPQLLIGMDIIGLGDFAVTHCNNDGGTTMSFCIPSKQEIDFVPKTKINNKFAEAKRRRQINASKKKKGSKKKRGKRKK